MALDCYSLMDLNCRELLFQIEEYELDEIKDILLELKKRTGINLDPYGNTRLYQDIVVVFSGLIRESLLYIGDKSNRVIRLKLLNNLTLVKEGLWMVGD